MNECSLNEDAILAVEAETGVGRDFGKGSPFWVFEVGVTGVGSMTLLSETCIKMKDGKQQLTPKGYVCGVQHHLGKWAQFTTAQGLTVESCR